MMNRALSILRDGGDGSFKKELIDLLVTQEDLAGLVKLFANIEESKSMFNCYMYFVDILKCTYKMKLREKEQSKRMNV